MVGALPLSRPGSPGRSRGSPYQHARHLLQLHIEVMNKRVVSVRHHTSWSSLQGPRKLSWRDWLTTLPGIVRLDAEMTLKQWRAGRLEFEDRGRTAHRGPRTSVVGEDLESAERLEAEALQERRGGARAGVGGGEGDVPPGGVTEPRVDEGPVQPSFAEGR